MTLPPFFPHLAAAAVLVVILGLGFAIASAARRGERGKARHRRLGVEHAMQRYLARRIRAAGLRAVVRLADEPAYWSALETLQGGLSRRQRLVLSRALRGNVHERRECLALRDDSPWRRELAARRLALLRSPTSRQALRRALDEGPELVTHAAALGLARERDPAALRWVLAHPHAFATRTPSAFVGLLRAFGPRALPALAETLVRGTDDPRLERAILETLGLSRAGIAVAAIEARLTHQALEVRIAAARALGRYQAGECVGGLIQALRDDAWQVRAMSAWALGKVRAPSAVPILTARLSDRSWWVRRHSAYALAAIGETGRHALHRVVEASPDPYARDIAIEALESARIVGV